MSREIKFRAYWKKEKRLCKVHSIHFGTKKAMLTYIRESDTRAIRPEGQGSEHEITRGVVSVPLSEIILEQSTGFSDKNGKEIYEGDIIHRGALSKVSVFRNAVIRFDDESVGFIAISTRKDCRILFNARITNEIVVVGNIHENPELLDSCYQESKTEGEAEHNKLKKGGLAV